MQDFRIQKLHDLMRNKKNIRNMSVIAHVDHGKSTLTDALIIRAGIANKEGHGARYMDTRKDEQERGITIKSTAVSMSFSLQREMLEAYCKENSFDGEDFLINLIDSPGHVDFSSEVTAALRVTDGALVVIDVVEGFCVQTETVLGQAIEERVKPTLVLNKIDRCLLELCYSPEEFMDLCWKRVETFNAKLGLLQSEKVYFEGLNPTKNDVSFCSGLQGWGFTLSWFARLYLKAKGVHTYQKEGQLCKALFSRDFYCDFTGQFPDSYKFVKLKKNEGLPAGKKYPFIQMILDPIYKVRDLCYDKKIEEVKEYLDLFGVDISSLDISETMDSKKIAKAVFKHWMPASDVLLHQIVVTLPNPIESQQIRAENLYTGPKDDKCFIAIKECRSSDEDPVMMYVSKMTPDGANGFVAFGRIFSGTLRPNTKVYVQTPDYDPTQEEGNTAKKTNRFYKTISKVVVMMGRSYNAIPDCPAGNIVGIVGVEGCILKTGTVTTSEVAYNIKTMKFSVSPVVKVALTLKSSQDLSRFKEGLDKLAKSDPLCHIEFNEQGQAVIGCAGELHLEVLLNDFEAFFGRKFGVEEPQVTYFEGIQFDSEDQKKIRMTKSPNKHNRIFMTAESLDLDVADNLTKVVHKDPKIRASLFRDILGIEDDWIKKIICFSPDVEPLNILCDQTKGIQYLHEVKDHIVSGMKFATLEGPLVGEKCRGVKFNLIDLVLHADAIHRGANQMIKPVEHLVRGLILASNPCIYEPIFCCTIVVPESYSIACENIIKNRRGQIDDVTGEGITKTITSFLPVRESFGLNKDIKSVSRGYAYCYLVVDHYDICPGSLEKEGSVMYNVVQKVRKYKKSNNSLDYADYFDTL